MAKRKPTVWYKSTATILINSKSIETGTSAEIVNEDILANHMEMLRSRRSSKTRFPRMG